MSSRLSPDMGPFFPGLEVEAGGHGERVSAPGRGARKETQEPRAENQTFQTILMGSCGKRGRGVRLWSHGAS